MARTRDRFQPPTTRFRARLSACVLIGLFLATGVLSGAHYTLADHHWFDACEHAAALPDVATLSAPHHHGHDHHHTLADHKAVDATRHAPEGPPTPAEFAAPADVDPPNRAIAHVGEPAPLSLGRSPRSCDAIRAPPSFHAC